MKFLLIRTTTTTSTTVDLREIEADIIIGVANESVDDGVGRGGNMGEEGGGRISSRGRCDEAAATRRAIARVEWPSSGASARSSGPVVSLPRTTESGDLVEFLIALKV